MVQRYQNKQITVIWSEEEKVAAWQRVELAVIKARVELGLVSARTYARISKLLNETPVNLRVWKRLEDKLRHDLNAFVEERKRRLPRNLRRFFHDVITSYDTEEPATAELINRSITVIDEMIQVLDSVISEMALRYRFTIMNGRSHGQEAELQSFGKRCLTWLAQLRLDRQRLGDLVIKKSKISGAIGNYIGISPELEGLALLVLGLEPFYGATQVMPRELYAPVANALCTIAATVDKISKDVRLMARSGLPLMQEPFAKLQTGSSAMPHKKNPISTEKNAGLNRVAQAYGLVAMLNISTWEERAIEQSSAERIIWPDLFHTVAHGLETLTKVLAKARVYADNMLIEVVNSRGCYAAAVAKDFLKKHGAKFGISEDAAYRIVQVAAFNVFEPGAWAKIVREQTVESFTQADELLEAGPGAIFKTRVSIRDHIRNGNLEVSDQLAFSQGKIDRWNRALKRLFRNERIVGEWKDLFKPSHLLIHEETLYKQILGV